MTMIFEDFVSSLRVELGKAGSPVPVNEVYFHVEFEYELRRGEYRQKIDVVHLGKGSSLWYKNKDTSRRNLEWNYGTNWEIAEIVRKSRLLKDPFLVVRVRRSR